MPIKGSRGKFPKIVKRVGESPPQYVDWDEEDEEEQDQDSVAGNLNDAKKIAVGVFQHNEIAAWRISPGIAAGSESD